MRTTLVGRTAVSLGLIIGNYTGFSQTNAPAALPPSLVSYMVTNPGLLGSTLSQMVMYGADGTYFQIYHRFSAGTLDVTAVPEGGTYTYTIDAHDPTHAVVAYVGGKGTNDLYFATATTGSTVVPHQIDNVTGSFTIYPRQDTNGGGNVSNRVSLDAGKTNICGFVVRSSGPRWVLIRAVGASLGAFGVSAVVSNPSFTLYDSTQKIVGTSAVWSADPNIAAGYKVYFGLVGAFPLKEGSDEAVLVQPLDPGAYTAVFRASSAGEILCEVYILPY